VRFIGSRLEGAGYQGDEDGGELLNWENGRGVERRCLVLRGAVGMLQRGGASVTDDGLVLRMEEESCRGGPSWATRPSGRQLLMRIKRKKESGCWALWAES
jgi:hypothetical protein